MAADLEWTIFRPGGRIYDGRDRPLDVDLDRSPTLQSMSSIPRAALARLMVRAVADGLWIRQAPYPRPSRT